MKWLQINFQITSTKKTNYHLRIRNLPIISTSLLPMQLPLTTCFTPVPRISSECSKKRDEPILNPAPSQHTLARPQQTSVPSKPVICFECGLISIVPIAALSTRCHHCSAYICMDDINIHNRSHKTHVQTWGDVTVRPDTDLHDINIQCRHLYLNGQLSGTIHCSGTCLIKKSQIFRGSLTAHTLEIAKRANLTFSAPIIVQQAIINGTLNGVLQCKGTVTLGKNAKFFGDVQATNLIFSEGSSHSGHFYKIAP
ncbi:MAG: polymer-forming cytoskeletal protein [Akkermansia sp.]